jgi:heme/copper-type cytochrome/quinol oxidase subunit 3
MTLDRAVSNTATQRNKSFWGAFFQKGAFLLSSSHLTGPIIQANGLSMAAKTSFSRIGFMLTCFLFPGLIGTFASFSIPAPVVDEMHQEAALDAVLSAPNPAAQQAAIANLANATDADTAALVTGSNGPIAARIAAARRSVALNIRVMVITFTILAAIFGVALMGPGKT